MSNVEESLETQARIGALRCEGGPHSPTGGLLRRLADEIMRLRVEVAALKEEHHFQACLTRDLLPYQERAVKAEAEIERLRELLRVLRRNPHIEEILRWDANLAYLDSIDAALKEGSQ